LHVALSGADFLIQNGRGNAFDGRVEPGGVTFSLGSLGAYSYYYFYYSLGVPDVAEKVSATEYLALLGKAFTKSSSMGLTGQFAGDAMLFTQPSPGVSSVRVSCHSSQHQFSLTPQTAATYSEMTMRPVGREFGKSAETLKTRAGWRRQTTTSQRRDVARRGRSVMRRRFLVAVAVATIVLACGKGRLGGRQVRLFRH
jgi:hypothetical protein